MESFKKLLLTKIGITGAVLSVITGLIVYLGLDIQNKSNLIFSKRSEINSRFGEIRDISRLRESAKVAEPLMAKLDRALPKRDYLFTLPREFERLASEKSLSFNFKFAEESKPDPSRPSQIKFVMTLQGKYNDVMDFISKVEAGPYFVSLSNLDMVRVGEADRFNVSLSGEIFFNE